MTNINPKTRRKTRSYSQQNSSALQDVRTAQKRQYQNNNYDGLPFTTPDGQLVQNYSNEGYYDIVPDDNAGNGYGAQINSTNYKLKMRANGIITVTNRDLVRFRTGIFQGDVYKLKYRLQNKELFDYFGNTGSPQNWHPFHCIIDIPLKPI